MLAVTQAVDDLAVAALALAVVSTLFLVVLVVRRLALAREARKRFVLEERLRPVALALLDDDDEELPLGLEPQEAALFAELLGRYARNLTGSATERLRTWFAASGALHETTERLHSRRAWRRAAAAYTLGDMASRWAIPDLKAALDDPDATVRAAAGRSLGRLGAGDVVADLLRAYADRRIPRLVAGHALLTIGDAALPGLLELARSGESDERALAVELVGLIGGAVDARPLVEALRDASADVRANAAGALGRLGDEAAAMRLREMLDDRVPFVRCAAADALGAIGDDEAVDALLRMATADEFEPARSAARALARIDPDAARAGGSAHLDEAADLLAL